MKQVQNTNISPYKGIVRIGSATGFVVGRNTILTNKHVLPGVQVGSTILAHQMAKMIPVDTIK